MIQIIILAKGLTINGTTYPENTLSFRTTEPAKLTNPNLVKEVEIKERGKVLFKAPYTDYMKSDSTLYASAQAVIDELVTAYS